MLVSTLFDIHPEALSFAAPSGSSLWICRAAHRGICYLYQQARRSGRSCGRCGMSRAHRLGGAGSMRLVGPMPGWRMGLAALNALGGRGSAYLGVAPSMAQIAAIKRMRGHFHYVDRRIDRLDPELAWRELARAGSGYAPAPAGVCSTGSVASFRDGAVKLPSGGSGLVSLATQLPAPWASRLESGAGILRASAPASIRCTPAVDPVLKGGGYDYGRVCKHCMRQGGRSHHGGRESVRHLLCAPEGQPAEVDLRPSHCQWQVRAASAHVDAFSSIPLAAGALQCTHIAYGLG